MTLEDLHARVEAGADAAHQRVIERMVDKLFDELERVVWAGPVENDYLPGVPLQECNCTTCQTRGQDCSCSYCRARVRYTAIKIRLHQITKHLRGGYLWDEPSPEMKTLFGARLRHWQDRAYEERMIMQQWGNRCQRVMSTLTGMSGTGGTINIRSRPWLNISKELSAMHGPTVTLDVPMTEPVFYTDDLKPAPKTRFGPSY